MYEYIDQFIDYCRGIKQRSEHTCISYEGDIKGLIDYCVEQYEVAEIVSISHLMVRSWIVQLKGDGLANASINRKISALKSFYKYLRRRSIVSASPLAKVQTLKKSKRLPAFVSTKKMEMLQEKTIMQDYDVASMRDQLVIDILYMTGMRRSELMNIRMDDIGHSRSEIKVVGKGNKQRNCPVDDQLLKSIREYRAVLDDVFPDRGHDYLIVTDKGKKAYAKLIFNIVSKALKKINGAERTSPHVLRHTFATHLSTNGAELNAVKDLLGHASLAATQIYTHNSIDRLMKEYRRAHPLGE